MPVPLVKLPSLDLVRGFVAVARRMSITLAADDLCVTQSAVSRQINALEAMLGVRLFHRGYRSISLTPEGERLMRVSDGAIQQLQEIVAALAAPQARQPVTITASVGIAGLWLLPRIGALQRSLPDVDLRIAASEKVLDLRAENIDLALRYAPARAAQGDGAPPLHLYDEHVLAVAHPSLNVKKLDAATLARHILLEFDGPRRPLLRWADHLGTPALEAAAPRGMLRFNQYDQVIQAAIAGRGIALGRLALIRPMLADGRLAAVGKLETARTTGYAYWLVQAEEKPRDDVRAVIDWIAAQARDDAMA